MLQLTDEIYEPKNLLHNNRTDVRARHAYRVWIGYLSELTFLADGGHGLHKYMLTRKGMWQAKGHHLINFVHGALLPTRTKQPVRQRK